MADKELKILLLEDSVHDAALIQYTLRKAGLRFVARTVDTEKDFERELKNFSPEVILSDHSLHLFNSKEALTICREQNVKAPFILVTGTVSEEFAVEIIREGAADYILKNNLTRLPSAILQAVKQREAEEELEASRRRFRSTIDKMLEGVQIIGHDWRYVYVNDAVARHGRYSKEELIGHTMMEKYPGIEHTEMFRALERCMTNRVPQDLENEFSYPDGSKGWFELSIQPAPEGILILSVDITQRKKAEAAIRAFNEILEERILERTGQLLLVNKELEEKNKNITDSVRYAERIQMAVLPNPSELAELFPQSFVFFKPKDIVSGDFFWFDRSGDKLFAVVGDCTGHGVPGALLSVLGVNILQAAFQKEKQPRPRYLLKKIDEAMDSLMSHRATGRIVQDGMDVSICEIDREKMELTYAGVNSFAYILRQGQIIQLRSTRYTMGTGDRRRIFEEQTVKLQKGDILYLFSDGLPDQFGGTAGKKFGYRRLRDFILSAKGASLKEQEALLKDTVTGWQGNEEQTDDILVMGVQI